MSNKRTQQFQGGGDRYAGMPDASGEAEDTPKAATAAQMAKRKIAQTRKPSGSQRSSRAGTPTGNAFSQPVQQSMPSFQPQGQSGTGFGGDFNFAVNANSNPFAQTNGTPPPTGFQFGAPAQTNGTSSTFGSAGAGFGSTFGGSNSAQPQQNGFNPSTTMFGQTQQSNPTPNTNTSSIFSSFGQNNASQPQQNGITPPTATTSSFPSFGKQNSSENVFKSFGQSQQQTPAAASAPSFTFGQTPQQNGTKPASTPFAFGQTSTNTQPNGDKPSFGSKAAPAEQTPKPAAHGIFAGFGQQNQQPEDGAKSLFPATSQAEQGQKPGMGGLFNSQPSAGTGLFGSTPPPDSSSQPTKPGESVFSSVNKKEGFSSNMFTQSRDSTSKPTNNLFGAPAPSNGPDGVEATPKPSNIFGQLNQTQPSAQKQSLFSGASASQSEEQTPKPTASLFSGAFGQQQSTQAKKAPMFDFGQAPHQDTSMTTPDATPQKFGNGPAQPAATSPTKSSAASNPEQRASTLGGSLSDRITPRDDPPTAQKSAFNPSTTLFNTPASTNNVSQSENREASAAATGNVFGKSAPQDSSTAAVKQQQPASTNPLHVNIPAAPWLSHGPSALTKAYSASQSSVSATPAATISTAGTAVVKRDSLEGLNEGLKAHLATQDPSADWTPIMQYYMRQAAEISKQPGSKSGVPAVSVTEPSAPSTAQSKPTAPANVFAASSQQPTPKPATSAAPAFQFTPKPATTSNLFNAPQTAPVNRKRPAEEEAQQPPATEKRTRANEPIDYPQLPANASETSRLFQAALDRSTGVTALFPQSASEAKQRQEERERSEREAKEKVDREEQEATKREKQAQSSGGFTPTTSSAPAGGSVNFLAAFGKKATEQEEKDRKKRKAEDYDSDEETEEAWLARDKLEQEAKRQKILEAAKSGAGWSPNSAGTPVPESEDGGDLEETPAAQSKSLFDRITPADPPATAPSKLGLFSSQAPASSTTTSGLFQSKTPSKLGGNSNTPNIFASFSKPRKSIETSDADKTEAEKDLGAGDNTWKPNTPIKFGGTTTTESTTPAAPPPFGNLFGTTGPKAGTDGNGSTNLLKPSFGFNFGTQPSSLSNSRATTPGVTTDGEGASTAGEGDGDDDEAAPPAEPQVEDQTGLRDSEKENEDVLYTVGVAKAMKFDEKKNDSGEMTMGWVDRGKGPLYILKHKETGKVRVVLKVPPYGVTKMNFAPLKDMQYEVTGKAGKMVQGVFVDHFQAPKDGQGENKAAGSKFSKWIIQVGSKEDADEIARVLMAERA